MRMKRMNRKHKLGLLALSATLCISGGIVAATEASKAFPSFENRIMTGQSIVIEAEDFIYGSDMEVIEESTIAGGSSEAYKVSGDKALAFTSEPEAYQESEEQNPSFMINFYAEDTSYYGVYFRIRPKNKEDYGKYALLMYSVEGEDENPDGSALWKNRKWQMNLSGGKAGSPAYIWRTLIPSDRLIKGGNVCIKFKYLSQSGDYTSVPFVIDKVVVTTSPSPIANGAALEPQVEEDPNYFKEYSTHYETRKVSTERIPVWPDEQQHPRVLVTKDEIPSLKENLNHPIFASTYAKIKEESGKSINGLLSAGNTECRNNTEQLATLQSRAFMYLIGEVDAAHADKTVQELKNYMATVTFDKENSTYMSRYAGDVTVTAAFVYDWCYDRLTDTDKEFIRRKVYEWQKVSEVGFPPLNRSLITGHGTENQITYHQMAAAIAFYDEEPDWYKTVAGIVFTNMTKAKEFLTQSSYSASYGAYFAARDSGFVMLDKMIKTLGYTEDLYGENYPDVFQALLYRSLPNGIWMKDGDDYIWNKFNPNTRSFDSALLMSYIGTEYDNPYLLRQGLLSYDFNGNDFEISDLFMIDPNKLGKDTDELPTAWKTTYPMTMMMARTGWQNGENSNTAVAFMNGREINVVDHQHRDAGTFQLYYKGMLAIDSGLYDEWGGTHHANYGTHTIAHNGMLIYDPEYETKYTELYAQALLEKNPEITNVEKLEGRDKERWQDLVKKFAAEDNDGGQRPFFGIGAYEDLTSDNGTLLSNYAAKTLNTYIGPNGTTPAFSYLSTDLSPAYDYRTTGYRRSMVFMDLFNDDYPAAMIVYDKVNATDKDYKKTWLLHSETEPVIDGTTTTITRTDNGQNGKLVNYTLLPEADNAALTKAGGKGNEFLINGTNYPSDESGSGAYGHMHDSGRWRVELSPKTSANDDTFLNAMYVTDADGNLPQLEVKKCETDTYVGAVVRDRMVTFGKSYDPISTSFELTVPDNGYDTVMCLLTDMEAGKWEIIKTTGGTKIIGRVESETDEKCIYFTAEPGTYTITPASATATLTDFAQGVTSKTTFGDFLIRKGNNLMYLPKPTKLVDGVPYVPIDGVMTQFGALVNGSMTKTGSTVTEKNDTTVTLITPQGETAVFTKDSKAYTLDGVTRTAEHPILWIDGEPYACLGDFASSSWFNLKGYSYNSVTRLLTATTRTD